MSSIADRLRIAREKKNLRQVQVAKHLGISNKTVSGYENAVSEPDIDTLARLAELYEVSVEYLINGNPKEWHSVDEVIGPIDREIAVKMKSIGVTAIQLTDELLKSGMTREELEDWLKMMIKLKANK